jgi:hypothetical protein
MDRLNESKDAISVTSSSPSFDFSNGIPRAALWRGASLPCAFVLGLTIDTYR